MVVIENYFLKGLSWEADKFLCFTSLSLKMEAPLLRMEKKDCLWEEREEGAVKLFGFLDFYN